MKISVLGTGIVGQTIGAKLDQLGHEVYVGTRNANETLAKSEVNQMTGKSFSDWHRDHPKIRIKDFKEIPEESDIIINATSGSGSLSALKLVGKSRLSGKILLDISNPLDFSKGMPPTLSMCNTDSLGEAIQREFPECKVVKSLNTMNCSPDG